MEVSMDKSKIMVKSTDNTHEDITMNRKKLVEVSNFKYLASTLSKDG